MGFSPHKGNCIDCPDGVERLIVVSAGRCKWHNEKFKNEKKGKKEFQMQRRSQTMKKAVRAVKSMLTLPDLTMILDELFSILRRKMAADEKGNCECCTCGKWFHWRQICCGHFQSRRFNIIRWNVMNTAPQCDGKDCNGHHNGNQKQFAIYIDQKWGAGTAEELKQLTRQPFKLDRIWVREEITTTKNKIELLKHVP